MKYQVLFSLRNNEEIFMNVVCYSCDWRFKDKIILMAPYMSQNKIISAIEANNVKIFFLFLFGLFCCQID